MESPRSVGIRPNHTLAQGIRYLPCRGLSLLVRSIDTPAIALDPPKIGSRNWYERYLWLASRYINITVIRYEAQTIRRKIGGGCGPLLNSPRKIGSSCCCPLASFVGGSVKGVISTREWDRAISCDDTRKLSVSILVTSFFNVSLYGNPDLPRSPFSFADLG